MIKAWTEYNLTTGEELTLITLIVASKAYMGPGFVVDSRAELAKVMGVSQVTLRNNVKSLMAKGLLETKNKKYLEVAEKVNQRLA